MRTFFHRPIWGRKENFMSGMCANAHETETAWPKDHAAGSRGNAVLQSSAHASLDVFARGLAAASLTQPDAYSENICVRSGVRWISLSSYK